LIVPSDNHAATVESIKKTRESLDKIKPFKVDFIQQVYTEEGKNARIDVEESGEIIFKNDKELKWTYLKPDFKIFLLEGSEYRFYDEDNEQLTIGKIKDMGRQWIWQLLFSDDVYRYSSVRDDGNRKTIRIKNDKDSLDIEITVDEVFLPVHVVQIDPSGARMIFHFKNYRPHFLIPADAFQLKVPQGVEVVREDEKENPGE
jgi:outer membrane lipoprotein-sorting protein